MNRRVLTKLIVQSVAVAFGLLGLLWIGLVPYLVVTGIRDSDRLQTYLMALIFILMGGILLAVAWQAIRRFGRHAIQNVTALVVLLAYSIMSEFLDPFQETTSDLKTETHYEFIKFFIPVVIAYLLWCALSRKLIEITKPENTQRKDEAGRMGRFPASL